MKIDAIYQSLYDWVKRVIPNAKVVMAYQNMPMLRGHVLLIDPFPSVESSSHEQGNPTDALRGMYVTRYTGSIQVRELNGMAWSMLLSENIGNPLSALRLQSKELVVTKVMGPTSMPTIDDASSEWYMEALTTLKIAWSDTNDKPVETSTDKHALQSIASVDVAYEDKDPMRIP